MAEDEAKPTCMNAEGWTLLDRQAMGAVRLSLAKNVAYNVVNEKTTHSLFKVLSNMYEKPSTSNKVFLIRQLVNTKMKEGASVADHSWSGTVTTVIDSTGSTKLKFDNIHDLILGEDIRRKTSKEYSNSLLSAEDKGRGRKQDRGHKQNKSRSKSKKRAGDSDDALVCYVENTVEDRIIDFGASFHATYCKEELERFKLHSSNVRLADDKTLDIASVGDVVLKTSFGISWTLKDVRYIPDLKRRLISAGYLDEKGYHICFGDQQWKVTKGSLVVARGNKRRSLYMVEVHLKGIGIIIDGSGTAALWFGEAEEAFLHNVREDNETSEVGASLYKRLWPCIYCINMRIPLLDIVIEDCSRVAVDMMQTFRVAYSRGGMVREGFLSHTLKKSQVVLVDILKNLAENDSIVAEHELSSKINQSPGESSDTSEGSENSRSFEDSGRSDEKDSKNEASFEEGGFETPQVQRSTREYRALVSKESVQWKKAINEDMVSLEKNQTCFLVRISAGKKASQRLWMFKVKEVQDDSKKYKAQLAAKSFQQKRRVDYHEIFFSVVKMTTIKLFLSIVASEDLHLEQLDVKIACLHGDLDKDIYMTQRVKKILYGLKQIKENFVRIKAN
nr:retrovirus-related Pol polyprotein from transposon TNT 1-94 [Tanacetum cinerariifolium]